jgi:hypothetical protein
MPDALAQRYEDCNGLDDDGDGIIDNASGSTVPRSLQYACPKGPGTDPECYASPVSLSCPNGAWNGACGYAGSKACVSSCNNAPGIQVCDSATGKLKACPPPPEACNGLDDNCDGKIDENNVCRQGGSCVPPTCGDGICVPGESSASCPSDCPP